MASGAGASIITSSVKIRLAFQHSLINTRLCFLLLLNGRAENSQKSPPDWGRLEYKKVAEKIPGTKITEYYLRRPIWKRAVWWENTFGKSSRGKIIWWVLGWVRWVEGRGSRFSRTKMEFFGGTKIHLFWICVEYLKFGAIYSSFDAIYLSIAK